MYCLQGESMDSMRKENVLDMMRKWRTEQEFSNLPSDDEDEIGTLPPEISLLKQGLDSFYRFPKHYYYSPLG